MIYQNYSVRLPGLGGRSWRRNVLRRFDVSVSYGAGVEDFNFKFSTSLVMIAFHDYELYL